jgi:hypothetical protein
MTEEYEDDLLTRAEAEFESECDDESERLMWDCSEFDY